MRHRWELSVLLFALVFAISGCTGDLGPQWLALRADRASIVFNAPGLAGTTGRFLSGPAADHSYTLEVGTWTSAALPFPKAQIFLHRLEPGYRYTDRFDLEAFVEGRDFFRRDTLVFQPMELSRNGIGDIEIRRFSADSVACVAFGQDFGDTVWDPASIGARNTERLLGYYCANGSAELSKATVERVINGIGVRSKEAPG